MKVLLTGATGFIGSRVRDLLLKEGMHVTALVRSDDAVAKALAGGCTPVRGSLTSLDLIAGEASAADAVVRITCRCRAGPLPLSMQSGSLFYVFLPPCKELMPFLPGPPASTRCLLLIADTLCLQRRSHPFTVGPGECFRTVATQLPTFCHCDRGYQQ